MGPTSRSFVMSALRLCPPLLLRIIFPPGSIPPAGLTALSQDGERARALGVCRPGGLCSLSRMLQRRAWAGVGSLREGVWGHSSPEGFALSARCFSLGLPPPRRKSHQKHERRETHFAPFASFHAFRDPNPPPTACPQRCGPPYHTVSSNSNPTCSYNLLRAALSCVNSRCA